MEKWLYLIAGGIVGTLARYVLAGVIDHRTGSPFPWGTLAVNVIGCLVIGFLDVILEKKFVLGLNYRLLLMTGFCGAFTTFSTLILDTAHLLKTNQFMVAFGNVMVSFAIGFAAFKLGTLIAEML